MVASSTREKMKRNTFLYMNNPPVSKAPTVFKTSSQIGTESLTAIIYGAGSCYPTLFFILSGGVFFFKWIVIILAYVVRLKEQLHSR